MYRKRAEEHYREVLICPLCDALKSNRKAMIDHLEDEHSDEEAIEKLGWVGEYPIDNEIITCTPVKRYCEKCGKETNQVHADAKDMDEYICLECKKVDKNKCWNCGGELVENYDNTIGQFFKVRNVKHWKCKKCGQGHYEFRGGEDGT